MSEYGEPWRANYDASAILDGTDRGDCIYGMVAPGSWGNVRLTKERINRIIACVNACAGVPTERLVEFEVFWAHYTKTMGTPLAHPAEPYTIEE